MDLTSGMLERESEKLGMSPHLRSVLQQDLPAKPECVYRGSTDGLKVKLS